ncbi:MAG: hypothetical protein UW41_C0009G0046 [Candidatus Collierbacteria bacterium GW2011_GWC2_44_18]|uniref:Uncharacterized protein n=1 Tax=Candidatus Collierbacteria bacterium GW2011_GWC2_44_18 TaxID=1618392 RepID=A0A0G1KMU5_9BACT|nr:MAG: hypothetical protein UW41_C0009G0046 [Candidatus Collierbacteria bacterium GW2011_GWC2_44_18]
MPNSASFQKVLQVVSAQFSNLSASDKEALIVVLRQGLEPQVPFPGYSVNVDYATSVEQMIKAGKYDWFNDDITSGHFPSNEKGKSQMVIYLLNFDGDISSENALQEMNKLGLRPATLKELLALGAQHPNLQRKDVIVALGSTWRGSGGDVNVPYLYGDESGRDLRLSWFAGGWPSLWRFAAVRK